ncbi:hypothetical protein DNTS_030350 [Danionella cerebrum]|uniref:Uncharacterized protein n=1 Tax=Danionella cerebrum TaxID=2873325 RepID=A0A553QIW8_9TELE|nr:hypothetical protein DNTS_030350 [Danionella translucida]
MVLCGIAAGSIAVFIQPLTASRSKPPNKAVFRRGQRRSSSLSRLQSRRHRFPLINIIIRQHQQQQQQLPPRRAPLCVAESP